MAKKKTNRPPRRKRPEPPEKPEQRFEDRAGMRLLQRAVNEGWNIPDPIFKTAPVMAARVAFNDAMPISYRLRATELLSAMYRDKIQAAIALDRMERLEKNEATDRVIITPDIDALAEQIIARRLGDDAQ